MDNEQLEKIRSGKNFYRDNFYRMLQLCYVLIVINFLLIGYMFYKFATEQPPNYYGTRTDGQLIQLYPAVNSNKSQ